MITGFHKEKCPACGHEFIAMEGGFLPNMPAHCPKCGYEKPEHSLFGLLREILFRKRR